MLLFDVNGQTLTRTDRFDPATDSVEYLKVQFTFKSSDWNGKAKTALFRVGDHSYPGVLNSANVCVVPWEALVASDNPVYAKHGHKMYVSLVGEYNKVRITTDEVAVKLSPSGYGDMETPAEPTQTVYQQLLTNYADALTQTESARAELATAKNTFANAIKGNLSGTVVFPDDVSPVEHNPVVKVHGKNLCSMNAFNSMTQNGASNTYDSSTHTITMNAETPLNNFTGRYCRPLGYSGFVVGTEYTISFDIRGTVGKIVQAGWDTGRTTITLTDTYTRYQTTKVATRKDEVVSFYSISTEKGGLTTGEYMQFANVQVEVGGTMTDYMEYVDPSTLMVTRCGKNLLKGRESDLIVSGMTFTVNDGGSITASGTCTGLILLPVGTTMLKAGMSYTLNGCPVGGSSDTYRLDIRKMDDEMYGSPNVLDYGSGATFTADQDEEVQCILRVASGATFSKIFYPMLRLDSVTDATHETHISDVYTPNADGTVSDITSLSPNMTILTDTEGVIVECEYIRDTNKVIEKLTNELKGV